MSGAERKRYPLRVDVAKPAVIYQPSCATAAVKSAPSAKPIAQGVAALPTAERVLGKRRRSGRTEFLVKWVGKDQSANSWELSKTIDATLIEQYDEVMQPCQALARWLAIPHDSRLSWQKRKRRQLMQSRLESAKQACSA